MVVLLGGLNLYAQETELNVDSLIRVQRGMDEKDTARIAILREIISLSNDVDTINHYASVLLEIAEENNHAIGRGSALARLSWCNYVMGDYTKSLEYAYNGIAVTDSLGETFTSAYLEFLIGNIYAMTLNATKADEFYRKALEGYLECNDTTSMVMTLSNIAVSHSDNSMYEEAEASYKEIIELGLSSNNYFRLAIGYLGLGSIALEQYDNELIVGSNEELLSEALKYLDKAYENSLKTFDGYYGKMDELEVRMQSITYLVSAILREVELRRDAISVRGEKLNRCRALLADEYILASNNGLDSFLTEADLVRTDYLVVSGQCSSALHVADSLYRCFEADLEQYSDYMGDLYEEYTKIYRGLSRKDDALKSSEQARYWQLKKRSNSYAVTATQSIAQAQFDEQMRQREIATKQNQVRLEEAKHRQTIVSIASIVVLVLVSLLALAIAANYRRQKRNNLQLNLVNSELELQKIEIEEQSKVISRVNSEMTDSITYASNIQKAAMPTDEQLQSIIGDHMLFYRPLNIVSGDYYWAQRVGNLRLLVVADCTGHGVPGAFVSLLGISILNEITAGLGVENVSASVILDTLRDNFKKMLKQNGNEGDNRDGMDLALVVIDVDNKKIHYSGAFRPLIMIHEGELSKIEADRMPIGSHLLDNQPFTDNVIDYVEGDLFYMFSDGITDQFGYNERGDVKKFTAKRLNSILLDIHKLPFSEQKSRISEAVDNWRNGNGTKPSYEQTDDTIVFGIRL
ncbi:MAG: SpoIIE family protein phosphatase [Bacteroidales bacterium]|nr:SpoIIE family protein phosphatase [Bacteroidales bacterium]